MKSPRMAVVTYNDKDFMRRIESLLIEYKNVRVKYFDTCAPGYFQACPFEFILINADRFHLKPGQAKKLSTITGGADKDCRAVLLMLTKNLSPSDFLRNQVYRVTDTIDIGGGMDVLKATLDTLMTRRARSGPSDTKKAQSDGV